MPEISIVSAYYDRKDLLLHTLTSMAYSEFKDFEYVIVDDGSAENHRVEDLVGSYPFIRVIRIEPSQKWHCNPCIPFNIGLKAAVGNIIIIQNPECIHIGDVISRARRSAELNKYLVFSCYSLSRNNTSKLREINFSAPIENIKLQLLNTIGPFLPRSCDTHDRYDSWFAHPIHRRCLFNFLTVIMREDLYDLGGFDEDFAKGFAYDDTNFASRIEKRKMVVDIIEEPFCLHQYHDAVLQMVPGFALKERTNRLLYEEKLKNPGYRASNSLLLRD